MIRFICDHCGTPFDEPVIKHGVEHLGEFDRPYTEEVCPICGCDSFTEADPCPKCGEPKPVTEKICKPCRDSLKARARAFFDTLTAEEEEQMDEWLDGQSVTDRGKWA